MTAVVVPLPVPLARIRLVQQAGVWGRSGFPPLAGTELQELVGRGALWPRQHHPAAVSWPTPGLGGHSG